MLTAAFTCVVYESFFAPLREILSEQIELDCFPAKAQRRKENELCLGLWNNRFYQ